MGRLATHGLGSAMSSKSASTRTRVARLSAPRGAAIAVVVQAREEHPWERLDSRMAGREATSRLIVAAAELHVLPFPLS